jgi:predicted PurR-regulated permease PerM
MKLFLFRITLLSLMFFFGLIGFLVLILETIVEGITTLLYKINDFLEGKLNSLK